MSTPIRTVVLDIDDTLYLERDYVRSGFACIEAWAVRRFGIEGVGTRASELFEAGRRRTTITDALADCGVSVSADVAHEAVETYRNHCPDIRLLPDARGFLELAAGVVRLAVVTDGPAKSQRAKSRALGLERWMDRIIVTDELGSSKPDPEMYRASTRGWEVAPDSVVYFGDNPSKDFMGALALGWHAVRVRRVDSLHGHLETPPGVAEVPDLSPVCLDDVVALG